MSRKTHKLAQLQSVTDAILLAEQSRLAAIAAEEIRLKGLLDELDQVRTARRAALSQEPDTAARAGADPLWQLWAEGRRTSLNMEMAKLRVRREDIRKTLGRAFGRNDVAEKLLKAERISRKVATEKRRDHTS